MDGNEKPRTLDQRHQQQQGFILKSLPLRHAAVV
jgi:hypothetical protein